jgi:hypothetical protein
MASHLVCTGAPKCLKLVLKLWREVHAASFRQLDPVWCIMNGFMKLVQIIQNLVTATGMTFIINSLINNAFQ